MVILHAQGLLEGTGTISVTKVTLIYIRNIRKSVSFVSFIPVDCRAHTPALQMR